MEINTQNTTPDNTPDQVRNKTKMNSIENRLQQNFDADLLVKQTQSYELNPAKKAPLKGTLSINQLWDISLANYESEWRHLEFILACYREGRLNFASEKYARILNSSPTEPIALKMRSQVEALILHKQSLMQTSTEVVSKKFSWFSFFVAVIGAVITAFGVIGPHFRNLIGVGISIFVMALGLRFIISRPD